MARTTLATLIQKVRGMAQAGTVDFQVAGVDYFSDDHIQDMLDRYRIDLIREPLYRVPTFTGGAVVEYRRFYSEFGDFEPSDGGTAVFVVQNVLGDVVPLADYTPDYIRGEVVFADDQAGAHLFLTGSSHDLYAAAAELWEQKASLTATSQVFDWSTDNMAIKRSQVMKHYETQAKAYANKARPRLVQVGRSDIE